MKTAICRWGNSFAIRIPKTLLAELNMTEHSSVTVSKLKDGIFIKRANTPNLKEYLSRVTPENLHYENNQQD